MRGTETEQNLLKAFAGESQAKNRYEFYAKIARKEGFEKVAEYFEETARNEQEHAKLFFKKLEGGDVEITAKYPAGILSGTVENLKAAAGGETEEAEILYPVFATVARNEGFEEVAVLFERIALIEANHAVRYQELYTSIMNNEMFSKSSETRWRCRKCGHEQVSLVAPEVCPVCNHSQGYFEINDDRF